MFLFVCFIFHRIVKLYENFSFRSSIRWRVEMKSLSLSWTMIIIMAILWIKFIALEIESKCEMKFCYTVKSSREEKDALQSGLMKVLRLSFISIHNNSRNSARFYRSMNFLEGSYAREHSISKWEKRRLLFPPLIQFQASLNFPFNPFFTSFSLALRENRKSFSRTFCWIDSNLNLIISHFPPCLV